MRLIRISLSLLFLLVAYPGLVGFCYIDGAIICSDYKISDTESMSEVTCSRDKRNSELLSDFTDCDDILEANLPSLTRVHLTQKQAAYPPPIPIGVTCSGQGVPLVSSAYAHLSGDSLYMRTKRIRC